MHGNFAEVHGSAWLVSTVRCVPGISRELCCDYPLRVDIYLLWRPSLARSGLRHNWRKLFPAQLTRHAVPQSGILKGKGR